MLPGGVLRRDEELARSSADARRVLVTRDRTICLAKKGAEVAEDPITDLKAGRSLPDRRHVNRRTKHWKSQR